MTMKLCVFLLVVLLGFSCKKNTAAGTSADEEASATQTGDRELELYMNELAAEHAWDFEDAVGWLLDHPEKSHPVLEKLVREGKFSQKTLGAIFVIGKMGKDEDVALLEKVMVSGDPDLTWDSAQALGNHPSKLALESLVKALENKNVEVVGAAAVALGSRKDEAARKPIEDLLDHESEQVRYRAVFALKLMGASPSADTLKEHHKKETSAEVRKSIEDLLNVETINP